MALVRRSVSRPQQETARLAQYSILVIDLVRADGMLIITKHKVFMSPPLTFRTPSILSYQGTAKLLYVTVRVFRTLLSKGLCSDETEDGEGEGEGDIDGMKVWYI